MASGMGVRPGQRKQLISARPSRSKASSDHDVLDYMTQSSDNLGRSVTMGVTVPPEYRRLATVILTCKKFPFETEQDVHRYALIEGLRKLQRVAKDKGVNGTVAILDTWLGMARLEAEMLFYQVKLDRIEQTVVALAETGNYVRAEMMAEMVWRDCDRFEDQYWAVKYRAKSKALLDRVRRLVKMKEKRTADED